ncbi:MAG: Sensory transduction protein regX3 [Anaerolineales bacterium]|nr:Sensory transduction protein regX3 [Anaerolineales bacterium]
MATRTSTLLLVEHDAKTAMQLMTGFRDHGFRALHTTNGRQGLEWARGTEPDLVLLNATLPKLDGFAVCRELRQDSVVPIIMLSALDYEQDRIKGLEIGADDYVVKPFSFQELLARVQALLRRRELDRRQISPPDDHIVVGDIVLDRATQQVRQAGRPVEMPQREFDLLRVLMEHAGQAVQRRELLNQVWGENWIGYPKTLNVHVYRLRKKLEDDPSDPRYIQTVRSYGYRFVNPNGVATA